MFVIWALPAYEPYVGGTNLQSTFRVAASIASVLPYVVVTKITSRDRPRTVTPWR
jgi:hypothetical protein